MVESDVQVDDEQNMQVRANDSVQECLDHAGPKSNPGILNPTRATGASVFNGASTPAEIVYPVTRKFNCRSGRHCLYMTLYRRVDSRMSDARLPAR